MCLLFSGISFAQEPEPETETATEDQQEQTEEQAEEEASQEELERTIGDSVGLNDLASDDSVGEASVDEFEPSEEISADNSVSFPIDI